MKEYKEKYHSLVHKTNSDLSLYSAGYEECTPGYSYGPTIRSYQLIHFVLNGKGELHINEHVFELQAGDVFLIPAGKVAYYKASESTPWSYAWVSFLGINSQMYMNDLIMSTEDFYVIRNVDTAKYKSRIMEAVGINGSSAVQYFQANSILYSIMAMLFDDLKIQDEINEKSNLADDIKSYLDLNYAEKIKLKDTAKAFGIHPNYLTRIFNEKYGVSPKQYLMELKI